MNVYVVLDCMSGMSIIALLIFNCPYKGKIKVRKDTSDLCFVQYLFSINKAFSFNKALKKNYHTFCM